VVTPGLELGIVADEIARDFGEAVRVGVAADLRRYEIRFLRSGRAPICDPGELREVERIAAGEGVEITALSPGLFKHADTVEKFRREMAEVFPRSAEWARRWRLRALIVFGFQKPGATEANGDLVSSAHPPGWVIDGLAEAAAAASAAGLKLLIEPEPICWADTGRATAGLIERAGSAALGVNYDPANIAWTLRRDGLDELATLVPLVGNVHVKDLQAAPAGSGPPTWVVPGEGIVDYRRHFALLRRSGYSGPVSLEPHLDGRPEQIERCRRAVARLWHEAGANLDPGDADEGGDRGAAHAGD
jgi:sugar phosphate isomerase/epimerase